MGATRASNRPIHDVGPPRGSGPPFAPRPRTRTGYRRRVIALALFGCLARPPVQGVAAPGASPRDALAFPGLRDVACSEAECRVLANGQLLRLQDGTPVGLAPPTADTLRFDGRWLAEGKCPDTPERCVWSVGDESPVEHSRYTTVPAPLDDGTARLEALAASFTPAWNRGLERGWRSGFSRLVVGPGGARITWIRGFDGAGQLVRSGAAARTARLGSATSPVSYPAWVAMHPTGIEAYLVTWPGTVVRGFDPGTLDIRWTLPLEGAAQGLFLDPGGRWLVLGVGPPNVDRLIDWPAPAPDPEAVHDPNRDEVLRAADRPPMDEVVVVDLATHTPAARAAGTFRRFLPLDVPLLATDREVVRLHPGDVR
jgi:hypothetical protein